MIAGDRRGAQPSLAKWAASSTARQHLPGTLGCRGCRAAGRSATIDDYSVEELDDKLDDTGNVRGRRPRQSAAAAADRTSCVRRPFISQ